MSESVFLAASGELEGSAADGGEEEAAGDAEGKGGRSCGCFVGVEQSAEVNMGTERGNEEGGAAAAEAGEVVHGEWWCAKEATCVKRHIILRSRLHLWPVCGFNSRTHWAGEGSLSMNHS